MVIRTFFVVVTGIALALCQGAQASEPARVFMEGTKAYQDGDWSKAITSFESLAENGSENGLLYYNLGNAHLKNDDLGSAVLWYERALKLIPNDPDLRFNYNYALTLTKDELGEKQSPLLRILFFWKYQLHPSTIRWIAIVLNASLWIALSVLVIREKRLLRPSIIILSVCTIVFSATVVYNFYESERIHYAVVLPEQVAVRSGFAETATQLFVLHGGTRVRVERESDTHLLIRYTKDKIGWVNKREVGII